MAHPARFQRIQVAINTNSGLLTIWGSNFGSSGVEVWFTNGSVTGPGLDPIVRLSGLSCTSGGTRIELTIPAAAGPGDVIVNNPGTGNATLSNAFPTDLVGTFGNPPIIMGPNITGVSPSTFDALIPGTGEAITIGGTDLDLVTSVTLGGVTADPSSWTIVDFSTITLDPPQVTALGTVCLAVSDGTNTNTFSVVIVAPSAPKLQMGTGDALNVVDRDDGLDFILSGSAGATHVLRASPGAAPSLNGFLNLEPANPSATLVNGGAFVIPAQGWISVHISMLPDPGSLGEDWFSRSFAAGVASNVQSIFLVQ